MKVLITGAFGTAGQSVVREMVQAGHDVVALDRTPLPEDLRKLSFTTLYADITDPLAMLNAVQGCTGIIHLAAYPNPLHVSSSELLRVNVIGTQNILDAAAAAAIQRVVLISSIGAIGFSYPTHPCLPDYLPVDAKHPRRPEDVYGLSKVMNEEAAAAASRKYGMTTIVLRPPMILSLERAKQRGWLRRWPEHDSEHGKKDLWGYIDVRDFARACRMSLESNLTGSHIFFVMADDVSAPLPAQELVEKYFPQCIEEGAQLPGNCLYDIGSIREKIGFIPKYTWREVLNSENEG